MGFETYQYFFHTVEKTFSGNTVCFDFGDNRKIFLEKKAEDGVHLVLIYETSGGKCGLQSQNRKRLYAPDLHEKTIKLQQETPVQHSQYSSTTTAEDRESNIN